MSVIVDPQHCLGEGSGKGGRGVTTFTGRKLDLLKAVRFDRMISDYAFRQEATGRARLPGNTNAAALGALQQR
jgi:hypothetical protein